MMLNILVKKRLLIGLAILLSINISFAQTKALKLDTLFNTLYKRGDINGCVLIAENGKPIYQKALGYTNLNTKQALTSETMFELASVSKQFTAMAIMQLEEKGKLKYDDVLQKYFPKLPYQGVTIKHLLHHTSGIPEFLGWGEKQVDINKVNNNADILTALTKNAPTPLFKPGEQSFYCNTNYVLLALIVEKASGLPFAQYLDRNVFKPLGMLHTRVYSPATAKPKITNFALGYVYDNIKDKFVVRDSMPAYRYVKYLDGVAGPYGISSTTGDLFKWDRALYTGKLISQINQAKGYIPYRLNNGSLGKVIGLNYGYGWLIIPASRERGRVLMHSGSYPGYQTIIVRYPNDDKTIIILTNKWNVTGIYDITHAVEQILFNEPYKIPPATPSKKSVHLSLAQLKTVEGVYYAKDAPQLKFTITSEMDRVFAQLTNQSKAEIYAENETDFFYTVVDAKIKFVKDEQGIAQKMILYQNGRQIEAIREK